MEAGDTGKWNSTSKMRKSRRVSTTLSPYKGKEAHVKSYEFTLRPLSDFGTPLKGDTLFGCFCWQAAYDRSLIEGGLEEALQIYDQRPFAVFSSAFLKIGQAAPTYVFKRPDLPLGKIFADQGTDRKKRYETLKENKGRKWMAVEKELTIDLKTARFFDAQELFGEFDVSPAMPSARPHNTINRLTLSTGTGAFAPYEMETLSYLSNAMLAVVVLIDEEIITAEQVQKGLEQMGKFGFGRDASIGMGRFRVEGCQELTDNSGEHAHGCYTLAPCVPDTSEAKQIFFSPFIRFGKHGDLLASQGSPFKNPVVMADEGAVVLRQPGAGVGKSYIGKAVRGISMAQPTAVLQGYSPYIPITLE
jgi:CRISPR-associated protein Csm4